MKQKLCAIAFTSLALMFGGQIAYSSPSLESVTEQAENRFILKELVLQGNSVLSQEDFADLWQSFQGKSVTLAELQQIADQITQRYEEAGYPHSQAILQPEKINNGVATINIHESILQDIKIQGLNRLNEDYVRSRLELGVTQPLQEDQLEEQINLLKRNPLFASIETELQPGENAGEVTLLVDIQENKPMFGGTSFNNSYHPFVGEIQFGNYLGYRNLTGLGDTLTASYFHNFTGAGNIWVANYSVPLNAMNGTLSVQALVSRDRFSYSGLNDLLGSKVNYDDYIVEFRQPLVRTTNEEFALSLGFRQNIEQGFLSDDTTPVGISFGADENGIARTAVIRFVQDYTKTDASGTWNLRSQFNLGTGLLGATISPDPQPDGRFFSWSGQVQRVQPLGEDHLLILKGDIQLSPDNLYISETFLLGGARLVRGYRYGHRFGDNGVRLSIEDQITIARGENTVWKLVPFVEMAKTWNNPSNPTAYFEDFPWQISTGLGVIWSLNNALTVQVNFALPLVENKNMTPFLSDQGISFGINYNF